MVAIIENAYRRDIMWGLYVYKCHQSQGTYDDDVKHKGLKLHNVFLLRFNVKNVPRRWGFISMFSRKLLSGPLMFLQISW